MVDGVDVFKGEKTFWLSLRSFWWQSPFDKVNCSDFFSIPTDSTERALERCVDAIIKCLIPCTFVSEPDNRFRPGHRANFIFWGEHISIWRMCGSSVDEAKDSEYCKRPLLGTKGEIDPGKIAALAAPARTWLGLQLGSDSLLNTGGGHRLRHRNPLPVYSGGSSPPLPAKCFFHKTDIPFEIRFYVATLLRGNADCFTEGVCHEG